MTIRAGELRHRITIQAPNTVQGGTFKDPQEAPTTFATVWARIRPLSGRRLVADRQIHPEVDHEVKIRYRPGVQGKMIVLYGTRTLRIDHVRNDEEDNTALLLICTEINANA